jgi:hypothetical protein
MKLPKKLFWWEKKTPVFVFYRAYSKDGEMLIEDRNPYEVVGKTVKEDGAYYQRIECYQVTPGWKQWAPPKEILEHSRTKKYAQIYDEE